MLEIPEKTYTQHYKIKLIVAVEKNYIMTTRNEILVPKTYRNLEEAQKHIEMDMQCRINENLYFRSQKMGYDLVRYSQMALLNTYISYRVIPVKKSHSNEIIKPKDTQKI